MTTRPPVLQSRAPAEGTPEQFRIAQVQLLNWGRYSNLETMLVGRAGTAILGPTGAGKSQILDAIAAVLMPNPQEFNQAARDDRRGLRAERTVYSYARGKTDQILDNNRHSSSTAYLRPPGTEFASGVAVITHLQAPTVDALATAVPALATHWRAARARWRQVVELHAIATIVKPYMRQIVDLDDADFQLLIAAAGWFTDNPRSGLTPRQVPVEGMHTKWLKRHRRLVLAILGLVPSNDQPPEDHTGNNPSTATDTGASADDEVPAADLDLLGLLALPRHIDIILTDTADRSAIAGLRHLRAPIAEIAGLPLRPSIVLIVENKESALLIPDHEGLVVIHSLGNHLDALTHLPWLNDASLLYWGDLDRPGITLLSRARALQPRLQSVLMDPGTVQAHLHLAVPERINRVDPPLNTLLPHEQAALEALTGTLDGQHAQLEQERLPAATALTAILAALLHC
ncbi:Wadjet anti-phage system protein JetD domain-containing protein [Kribbella sp. CA-245084]|uniref:Wadjet anti-phage system protein JetD domain-containing protein n=1 Tax=Kribbella sp. CA-245084 TaxID=3239940 RepID=UPI003D8C8F82